ncbi:hypothetical protein [Falsiroseomonas sp. E2-1-a20]|uniref:hypothetical protein n=1 Tax=Falsiroseomonas sp. E2-1-a20 TaxID=3239300 RepID=UPI003F2D229E
MLAACGQSDSDVRLLVASSPWLARFGPSQLHHPTPGHVLPGALPPLPGAVHVVLAGAFAADGGALRRIRLGLRGALGAAALGGDPVAAARDALGPEAAVAIGFHRAATPAR